MHVEFDVGVQDLVSFVATVCTIGVFLTPIGTCRKIVRKGSSGDTSFFPFLAMFSTSSLWLKYGLMKNDRTLMVVNSTGAILCFIYMLIYYIYTLQKTFLIKQMFGACCVLFPIMTYIQYYTVSHIHALSTMGTVCAIGSICSYGSPLSAMTEVLRSKSTECMSFSLSLSNFIVAAEWMFYGYLLLDMYIVLPNLLGVFLSSIQLVLFYKYPAKKAATAMGPITDS